MAADEEILGNLHNMTAAALIAAMRGTVIPGYTDPETEEVIPEQVMPPSAAIIQAAAKFLKDNNVTCVPSKDNALGELEQQMARRREKRVGRAAPADFASATEGMGFMRGLPN